MKNNYLNILERKNAAALKYGRNPDEIKILAVSKTQPYNIIANAVEAGITTFAENYAQEFRDKYKKLIEFYKCDTPSMDWHFIGHLQTNKIKYVVPFVSTIHTVDSSELAQHIDTFAEKHNKKIDVLIQVNTSEQASKNGIEANACTQLAKLILPLKNINLVGFMTIGTFSDDEKIIRKEFSILRNCLNKTNLKLGTNLSELSMGMSHDFEIAIEEGSTILRIGTGIFGERHYI